MRVEDTKGNLISSLTDWAKLYESSPHQWKKHRSAYSVADFVINHNGAESFKSRISEALCERVELERAVPEFEVRFDQFGQGRVHDLAIYGNTYSGKSLFVGVEAKVDEPFGLTVRDAYLSAKAKQIAGEKTNAPDRIEKLLKQHFTRPNPSMFDVRYQLLYATAGTLAVGADISILYVVVFRTPLYNETTGKENYRDYVDFLSKVNARSVKLSSKDALAYKLFLQEKELICLHEYLELKGC